MSHGDAAEILRNLDTAPLSRSLERSLRVAAENTDAEFEHWLKMESFGYLESNPAHSKTDTVPAYRNVIGQYHNAYGQVLRLADPALGFVNENSARWGVAELEEFYRVGDYISVFDAVMSAVLREHTGFEAEQFRFDPRQFARTFSAIRVQLAAFLIPYAKPSPADSAAPPARISGEIIVLKPSFMGMGIDLRALLRRISGWWASRRVERR